MRGPRHPASTPGRSRCLLLHVSPCNCIKGVDGGKVWDSEVGAARSQQRARAVPAPFSRYASVVSGAVPRGKTVLKRFRPACYPWFPRSWLTKKGPFPGGNADCSSADSRSALAFCAFAYVAARPIDLSRCAHHTHPGHRLPAQALSHLVPMAMECFQEKS